MRALMSLNMTGLPRMAGSEVGRRGGSGEGRCRNEMDLMVKIYSTEQSRQKPFDSSSMMLLLLLESPVGVQRALKFGMPRLPGLTAWGVGREAIGTWLDFSMQNG